MKLNIYSRFCLMFFLLIGLSHSAMSQTTITGKASDPSGDPLIGANVLIKGTSIGTVTDIDGSFSLSSSSDLPITLVISYTGYTTQEVTVVNRSPLNVTLSEGILAEQVVVSASRKREKVQEAPASVSVLSARKLAGTPQTDAVRNLINVPGVQLQQQSAARINIEMRASAGIFGTSVFPIMDYRSLIGPGIGTFQSDASGISTIDLARIEVVRGPGSALYGPGVTAGVVHFITKNPIDYPGTTVQVGYGEMSTLISSVRHAGRNENKTFGYKINAMYNRGDEFLLDGSEGTTDASGVYKSQVDKFKTNIIRPAIAADGHVDLTQPGLPLETLTRNKIGNVMQEDFWNVAFNGTLEFRPQDDLSVVVSGGYNEASAVFYNDLGEGLSQAAEIWTQARVQKGGLFAQIFYVDNDGGTNDKPTILYQTGNMTGVGRKQLEGQIQYNLETPDFLNADWTVGVDYRQAISDTRNLTYGRNENDDDFNIFGGYLQGKFGLLDKLDLVAAGRYDRFNILDEGFFSPRVALVYKADPKHTFRASFNRAGQSATALETFIDFPVNAPIPGVYDFWLAGQNEIQTFPTDPSIEFVNHNVVAAGINAMMIPGVTPEVTAALAGLLPDELAMGALGANGVPLSVLHGAVTQLLLAQLNGINPALAGAAGQYFAANVPAGQAGVFFGVNAFDGFSPLNQLIPTNKQIIQTNNTYELGYKGLIADKLSVSIDVYQSTRKGFSDFTQIAPLITLQGKDPATGLYNMAELNPIAAGFQQLLEGAGLPMAAAQQLAGAYLSLSQLGAAYYGTGTVETNRMPQGDGIMHIAAGYRLFPDAELSYWGSDIGLEYYFNQEISAFFNYSWVSKTDFTSEDLGESADSPLTYYLNTPKNKFRLGVNYLPESGIRGNLSFQHDDSFYANVGDFAGDTDEKNLIDAGVGYAFGNGLAIDITGQNILDNKYRAFVNMPEIGRRILVKATYTFGAEK